MQKQYGTKGCYEPHAVCTARVGRDSQYCGAYFDFRSMPQAERHAFAEMHGMSPKRYKSEENLIRALERKSNTEAKKISSPKKSSRKSSPKRSPVRRSPRRVR